MLALISNKPKGYYMEYLKENFTVTSTDLSKAHGVTINCINVWANKGAFPHAIAQGGTYKKFDKATMTYTMGQIKSNRQRGKFKTPVLILDPAKYTYEKKQASTSVDITLGLILDELKKLTAALG